MSITEERLVELRNTWLNENSKKIPWGDLIMGLITEVTHSREVLLAIAAEDWNDETQPLLDGKPQGIGPCARARRALGIESFSDAFEKRMKSLSAEYRSKRFKEGA